jgi:hypothetical protein
LFGLLFEEFDHFVFWLCDEIENNEAKETCLGTSLENRMKTFQFHEACNFVFDLEKEDEEMKK